MNEVVVTEAALDLYILFLRQISQAIVNLQKTSKDARAEIVVRAKIDTVMRCLMRELSTPIPVGYFFASVFMLGMTFCFRVFPLFCFWYWF